AMAHPTDQVVVQAGEQPAPLPDPELGLPKLALRARHHLSPQLAGHELHPITDTQNRDALLIERWVDPRRARGVDALRSAREDQAARTAGQDLLQWRGVWQQLAVDMALADPAGDQLAVLGAKIKDEDGLRGGRCHRTDYSKL